MGYVDLIERAASKGKPMILSCATNFRDRGLALDACKRVGLPLSDVAVLWCIGRYPAEPSGLCLQLIPEMVVTLKSRGVNVIGFSDHTDGILAPVVATSVGARIIEKHFTLDRNQEGPDHCYALEPKELGEMVKAIREAERMLI